MRIFIPLIIILLTTGCSGLADAIRKNQQKQQIYKQHASKYHASCQKEAFSYYPVAIVTETKTRKNLIETPRTTTCNKIGNTINCRDTTIDLSGLSGAGTTTTSSYDANASSRNNHIKNCIDNNLRNDSSFGREINRVKYSTDYSKYNSIQSKASKNNTDTGKGHKLNGYDVKPFGFRCYYGRNGQFNIDIKALPCPARLE